MRIAVDGPVASGKTSAGSLVAARLGYRFLDTGLMYRAVTWAAARHGMSSRDEGGLMSLAREVVVDARSGDRGGTRLLVAGRDATDHLRDPSVDGEVSAVSAVAGVREILVDAQRRVADSGGIVMVGRDIGTVVLPDAELKVYLIASASTRARRRHLEDTPEGTDGFGPLLERLKLRDRLDSTRSVSPLRPATDAEIVDTDDMDLDEVVAAVISLARRLPPLAPESY